MHAVPLVSVLVPAYNHERWVGACLDSVIADGYPNFEIRVRDDGSSDRTAAAIEEWMSAAKGVPVHFTQGDNRGTSASCNEMIAAAQGELIAFVASDDLLLPGGIGARVAKLSAEPLEAVFGDCLVVDGQGTLLHRSGLTDLYHANKKRLSSDLLGELITNWSVPGPVLLARKSTLVEIGGLDQRLAQDDWDLYLRLADRGTLGYLDMPVAAYRLHGANIAFSSEFRERQVADGILTLQKAVSGMHGRGRVLAKIQLAAAKVERRGFERHLLLLRSLSRVIRFASRLVARSSSSLSRPIRR